MRLSVIMGTQEEYEAAVAAPGPDADWPAYYTDILSRADAPVLDIRSVPPQDPPSKAFFKIGLVETAVMDYLRDHDTPGQVRVVCTDEEIARLYKVVYNFNFATTKADRMMDDRWD